MKFQTRLFYGLEVMATGYYRELSGQYEKKNPDLAKKLLEFADDEYEHSKLFKKCYLDSFGKSPGSEGFWRGLGKFQAILDLLLPLKVKIKIVSTVENMAVKRIGKEIASGNNNAFVEIVKKILPDEKRHAELYRELYGV